MSATRGIEAVAVPWPGQLAPSKLLAYAVFFSLVSPDARGGGRILVADTPLV
jgi:hypothetical protein